MKTLTTILYVLMKKIRSYPNFSVIISLSLILFIAWMTGFDTTCYAQSPWTKKTNMGTVRIGHSSIVMDGKVYVMGGSTSTSSSPLSTIDLYDPLLDTWTPKANMNTG